MNCGRCDNDDDDDDGGGGGGRVMLVVVVEVVMGRVGRIGQGRRGMGREWWELQFHHRVRVSLTLTLTSR